MAKVDPRASRGLPRGLYGASLVLVVIGSVLIAIGEELAPAAPQPPAAATQERPGGKELPKVVTDNKNTLVKAHRDKLKATASTFWPGWEPEKVIDGDVQTSWFTQRGDAAAKGTKPWVMVTFPKDVTVTRVTIVGNREPSWFDGYTIVTGLVEF